MALLHMVAAAACAAAGGRLARAAGADASGRSFNPTDLGWVLRDVEAAFQEWAAFHGRQYEAGEVEPARAAFEANARVVAEHNARGGGATLALNEFADMEFEQFVQSRLGLDLSLKSTQPHAGRLASFRYAGAAAPDEVDWVSRGAVSAVKNQGSCGSCWAFSTTGAIEGANFLDTGELLVLSEQELVDCDKAHDNGCGGGLMDNAFQYVLDNGGLDTERDYAYWGAVPSFCNRRKQKDRHVVDITGFEDVPHGDEDALKSAVAHQPVAVAVCVNRELMLYHSGVYDGASCTGLNHGVLLVGYGTAEGGEHAGDFWKVKNSWGSAWGEAGYFRLKRGLGAGGQNGVAKMASYPVKDDDSDPKVPTICDPQLFSLWECPVGTSCQCDFSFFGLLCFVYSCPPADAVSCGVDDAFCPSSAPMCDLRAEACHGDGIETGMLRAAPAVRRGEASHRQR